MGGGAIERDSPGGADQGHVVPFRNSRELVANPTPSSQREDQMKYHRVNVPVADSLMHARLMAQIAMMEHRPTVNWWRVAGLVAWLVSASIVIYTLAVIVGLA